MALEALKRPKTESVNQSSERILMQKIIASLSEDERADFEERAGIMEYHGGLPREEAERRVLEIVFERRRLNDENHNTEQRQM